MRHRSMIALLASSVLVLCGADGGCTDTHSAAQQEAASADRGMTELLRNQPIPAFDYSLERHMLTEIYKARQRATNTYSVVQSDYTGKILWACPSLGFPIPYATQITNPHQLSSIYGVGGSGHYTDGVIDQPEPNGLYTPSTADGTWVPCVDADGRIAPVYEERHVSVFLQPMREQDGRLVAAPDSKPSFSIDHP